MNALLPVSPLTLAAGLFVLGSLFTAYRLYHALGGTSIPSEIPWGGDHKTWYEKARAALRDPVDGHKNIRSGWEKYGRFGKPFVMARISMKPTVVIPVRDVEWLNTQPEELIDVKAAQLVLFSLKYIQTTQTVRDGNPHNFFHEAVVRKDLTRQLGHLLPDVTAELHLAVDELWGTDAENFREVAVMPTLTKVVSRTTNRILVGLPLCRDEEFNNYTESYAGSVGLYGILLNTVCPEFLKPILGPLITYPATSKGRKYHRMLLPYAKQRIREHNERQRDPERFKGDAVPNDFLQWMIEAAAETGDAHQGTPDSICTRLGFIEFVGIHTSSMTATNAVFDLSSGTPEQVKANWDGIRREADTVLSSAAAVAGAGNGDGDAKWSRQALGRMVRTDSAIRESMRLQARGQMVMERQVVADAGVVLPSGERLPKGTYVAMSTWSHHDDAVYDRPDDYLPFRFADMRAVAGADADEKEKESAEEMLKKKNLGMTTVTDKFMPFGYGKHACPGRFFASQEIKVLLAYIAKHYEIEPLPKRPEGMMISTLCVPPAEATIRVRRRKL